MQILLTVLQVLLSLALIGLVLIQHGRGADAGAAFGSGASSTVFGARGSGSFLSRATAILAALFFLTSMALAYYAAQVGQPEGLMDRVAPVQGQPVEQIPPPVEAPGSEVPLTPMGSAAGSQAGAGVPEVAPATKGGETQAGQIPSTPAEVPQPQ